MEDVALRNGTAQPDILPDALALLVAQHWRGNIRELRNVLEQVAMRSDAFAIGAAEVEAVLREAGVEDIHPAVPAEPPGDAQLLRPLAQQVAETERRAIAAAMAATGGNKLATARMLGISRATLYERLENPEK